MMYIFLAKKIIFILANRADAAEMLSVKKQRHLKLLFVFISPSVIVISSFRLALFRFSVWRFLIFRLFTAP